MGTRVIDVISAMTKLSGQCRTDAHEDIDTFYSEIRSSCALVMDSGAIAGILTERDIVRMSAEQLDLAQIPVETVMTSPVITAVETELKDLFLAVNLLKQNRIRHLPILDAQHQVRGIISHESLRHVTQPINLLRSRSVREVMTTKVISASPHTSLLQVAQLMAKHRISSVLMVEDGEDGKSGQYPVGILTERDMVQFQTLGLGLGFERFPAGDLMSSPVFTVSSTDSLWTVHDLMQKRFIRRVVVTGEAGELQGIVTQTSLLNVLNPVELYRLSEVLETEVSRLKVEKQALLESHAQLLEAQLASQNQVLQRRIEQEQLMSAMAEYIRSSQGLSEILNTIVSQLRQVLKCERVNIWQFMNEDWDAQVIAESSLSGRSLMGVQLQNPCFKTEYAELYYQGRIRVVSDIYSANLAQPYIEMLEGINTRAQIIVPILFHDKLWGLLNVSEGGSTRTWQPDEIEFVSMFTGHVGLALEQAHTHEQLQQELRERQESEAILQHLLAGTSAATGPSFFPALVQHLAEALKVSCVLVAELREGTQQFETLAVWQDGQLHPNFSYNISEPCLHQLQEGVCSCLQQGVLPESLGDSLGNSLGEIQSTPACGVGTRCLGVMLENHEGKLIGTLRILDVRPLDNPLIQEILKCFATRASAELERQRATIALEQANRELEAKVAARTEALQKAEAKYREIYEHAVEGIYQSSLEGQFLMVNLALAHLYGYASPLHLLAQQIDLKADLYVDPDRWTLFQKTIGETGFLINFESEVYCRDGSTLWVSESGRVVKNERGEPLYYEIIVYDISDQKHNARLLKEMTQRLSIACESAQLAIWDYDIVQNTLVWDDRMFELYGVEHTEFCGAYEAWQAGLHPEDRAQAEAELWVAIEGGQPFHTEFRVVWPTGETRHIEAHAVVLRDAQGQGIRMIGVNRDITAQKKAAFKLLRQRRMLENMSELGQVGAWEVDLRSQQLYWSPMTKILHEVAPDYEPKVEAAIEFYKPEYQEQVKLGIQEAIEFGVPWYVEAELTTAKGKSIWVATTGQAEIENGVCQRLYGSFQDISGRKAVEEQLIKAKNTAEQALKAKSSFLAMMSHEIRTPMNGVIGMLNLLQKTPLDEGQQLQASIALSSAESLLTLINDILDFSKVEAGKLDLEVVEFDLIHYISDCVQSLALKALEKNLELVLDLRDISVSHGMVKGDPGRLRQILTNLINNALKFTEMGEVLVKCSLTCKGEVLLFKGIVQDTGIGIAADKIEDLFSSFTQVHTTQNYGGTGLGLAICKKLCELMGGTITVTSEAGRGSEFTFTLLLQPGESETASPRLPLTGDLQNLTILVVDDNATNRDVLAGQLRLWGAKTVTTDNAEMAIALCEVQAQLNASDQPPFDMAILDMKMPETDGSQLSQSFKTDPRFEKMPLLMMSSLGGDHEARNFADLGFSAYLIKPVSPSALLKALLMVRDGGQTLTQAGKILTQHYIQSFDFSSAPEPPQRQWVKDVHILLVEDSPVNQIVAKGLLKELGLTQVDVAFNGQEALVALQRSLRPGHQPYSLVLMDCQMPEMDGYTASRAIREGQAGAANQSIPIIAMTAYAMAGDRQRCLDAGMTDYVTKPIALKTLSTVLHHWLASDVPLETDDSPGQEPKIAKAPTEVTEPAIFDRDSLLERVCGQVDLAEDFCRAFLNGTPVELEKLHHALDGEDWLTIEQKAHSLRSSAGMIGAEQLKRIADKLEKLAQAQIADSAHHKAQIQALITALDQQFALLTVAIGKETPESGGLFDSLTES